MTYRSNNTDIRSFWVNEPKFFATYSINSSSSTESLETILASSRLEITLSDNIPLIEGIYIRNTASAASPTSILNVFLSSSDIGTDRYLRIPPQQQVFISTKDPSDFYITTTSSTTVSYSIIAY